MSSPTPMEYLQQYEALDVVGTGSFGIIRKVRRVSDSVILARKEINFERMSERDRKQIVAEVNILKDLNHENIVRYHDRFIDRDQGILYIHMEYCGGGDLGGVIKNCARTEKKLPEDTIWNYFLQILLALDHCHTPQPDASDPKAQERQILHRDLKPDNVFLDENHTVKLGDFGLSKVMTHAALTNTYVGTPYYMSPELIQEKAYDSKSDIWSLGCLVFELCALHPPFFQATTQSELTVFIRSGRIPPIPREYSHSLHQIIKAMLNVNPALRPSAHQLLQHERLQLVRKVRETNHMLSLARAHKQALVSRERDIIIRERQLQEHEAGLQARLAEALATQQAHLEAIATQRVQDREAELRQAVMRKEEEVRIRMAKREEELLQAVMKREEELRVLWEQYETGLRKELQDKEKQLWEAEQHLRAEWEKLEAERNLEQDKIQMVEHPPTKTPVRPQIAAATEESPMVMHGIIVSATGEMLATPAPAPPVELTRIVRDSPRVKLNFETIFKHDEDDDTEDEAEPTSPTTKTAVTIPEANFGDDDKENSPPPVPATRLRKPSIRTSLTRPTIPDSTSSCPTIPTVAAPSQSQHARSSSQSALAYDLEDDENLPSPFIKRKEASRTYQRRPSTLIDLRTKAVTNAALKKKPSFSAAEKASDRPKSGIDTSRRSSATSRH